MPEMTFLDSVRTYLAGPAGLSPLPGTVSFAVPVQGDALPLIALSLGAVERLDPGLGGGTAEIEEGALRVTSTIDLANPVLPGPDGFTLLDASRRILILPHGGLVRADGLAGALGPADVTVTVAGAARTLVAQNPGAGQYTLDPGAGVLTFGGPGLPAAGDLVASYHLGIWQRSTTQIRGQLDLGIWDTDLSRLTGLSGAAVRALLAAAGGPLPGLQQIRVTSVGEVGAPQPNQPRARERRTRFSFQFEHAVDAPVSSGGIIRRLPITSRLAAFIRDPATGSLVETVETEAETQPR